MASTLSPRRAMSIAQAAPAQRAPTTSASYFSFESMFFVLSLGRGAAGCRQMVGEVLGQRFRVRADAVEEARLPAAQEAQAEHVEAGRRRDPTAVDDLARRVEDRRDLEPAVVAPVAGGPQDRRAHV